MEERLDFEDGGDALCVFRPKLMPTKIGIYVRDDDGPAVFYVNNEQARQIIDMLEKLIENK